MKIYLDMDGVIADFFGEFEILNGVDHWKEIADPIAAIEDLKLTNFFDRLNVFPTSKKLVHFVSALAGENYGICSSPIIGDEYNSAFWKRNWLSNHGFLPTLKNLIITHNKPKYATGFHDQPNILVDDKPKNVDDWNNAGGIGILYQANQDSIDELFAKLKEAYNE